MNKVASMQHREYLRNYKQYLCEEERSQNTIQKYLRDVKQFLEFMEAEDFSKMKTMQFKEAIVERYAPVSANSMLAAVNGFLDWLGHGDCKVKLLRIQKNIFSAPEQELTQSEYERLLRTAEQKQNKKLSLLLQTICATGIRVSELRHIHVSALHTGRTVVSCKGKNRAIFIPQKLCGALKAYCKENHIIKGAVFITKGGNPLDRSNIWKMMKALCKEAKVAQGKVFPHNLRHLFARTFYKIEKDISRLADVLGHSSINTTRIYTMETGVKHARLIDRLHLVYQKELFTT